MVPFRRHLCDIDFFFSDWSLIDRLRSWLADFVAICPPKYFRIVPLSFLLVLAACAGGEPETKLRHIDTFAIVAAEDHQKKQTKDNVTIEDQGEIEDLVQPVVVQACEGAHLRFNTKRYVNARTGRVSIQKTRVMIKVDPLEGVYVRRFRITNGTPNVLRLDRADAVLVDPAGNDNELADFQILAQNIRAKLPCISGKGVVGTLRPLKILGSDVRIRPGRETTFYAMFTTVDKSILGDWTLELNDFPVRTDEVGRVAGVQRFMFPLRSKGFRTTVTLRRDGFLSPWVEIDRKTKEIGDR